MLRNVCEDATFFKMCRHEPLLNLSDKKWGRSYDMHVERILIFDSSARRITVRKSIILYPGFNLKRFAPRTMGRGEFVGYYQEPLAYSD